MNTEYLAFVDEIGRTKDGEYLYRLDFTYDADTVWGEYFNIVPAVIIPDIQPDNNSLSHSFKIISKYQLQTAKRNACFSMQDCIDGIISLCFSDIYGEYYKINNLPFYLRFGEIYDEVVKKLNDCGIIIFDIVEVKKEGDGMIDRLIDQLGDNNNSDIDDF